MGATAEYTRGFDRTSDMYHKYFDRDTSMARPADLVSNPVDSLSTMPLSEALKRLSLDEIARLKGGR